MHMSIRYITTGNEFAAKGLLGEGRHQLSILKNAMSFQNLQQNQRTVRYDDGTLIRCTSVFGRDQVEVFVPFGVPVEVERKIIKIEYCWCSDYFTEGKITGILGDYGDIGEYGEETYPDYCNSDDKAVKNYIGIRYKVTLCQGNDNGQYICLPSDFAEYEIDDRVIVFMRGVWKDGVLNEPEKRDPEKGCTNDGIDLCIACEGTRRKNRTGDEADGSFLISPLEIAGVNLEM